MAAGSIHWFAQALADLGNKVHNLSTDTLKIAIVTAAKVPAVNTAAPHFGGTGTTDFSSSQVALATSYTGPRTLLAVAWVLTATGAVLRATDVLVAVDALGFTNGAFGLIYNDTDANKRALGWVELAAAGTISIASVPLLIDWGGSGTDILTLAQA